MKKYKTKVFNWILLVLLISSVSCEKSDFECTQIDKKKMFKRKNKRINKFYLLSSRKKWENI